MEQPVIARNKRRAVFATLDKSDSDSDAMMASYQQRPKSTPKAICNQPMNAESERGGPLRERVRPNATKVLKPMVVIPKII